MAQTYNLDEVAASLSYPVSGRDVIEACNQRNFPQDFMDEFSSKIRTRHFESEAELHEWFAEHLTTHMAGLLGGATVHDLISKAKKSA